MGGTITDLAAAGSFGGTGHVGDESHVIGSTVLPDLGITVLAHQRQSGIDHTVAGLMATSVRMGLFIAIGLVGVTAASTAVVVDRYENLWGGGAAVVGSSDGERERRRVHVR